MSENTRKTFVFGADNGFEDVTENPPVVPQQVEQPQEQPEQPEQPEAPQEPENEHEGGEVEQPEETSEPPEQPEQGDEGGEEEHPQQPEGQAFEGDEGEEPEGGEESQVFETDSFYAYAAARMKEAGELPDDFELPENADDDTVADAIFDNYYSKLQEDAQIQYLEEFKSEIAKQGWTNETLTYASMLQNGVSPEDITRIVNYDNLAQTDIENLDGEATVDYVKKMYMDQEYKPKDIKRILDTAEVDGEMDALKAEAKEYFAGRKEQEEEFRKRQAIEMQQLRQQQEARQLQIVNNIFETGEFAGEQLNDDMLDRFESAIFEPSIPFQGQDGIVRNATPFQQFQNALQQNFELQLWAFKKYMFREEESTMVQNQAQQQADTKARIKWSKSAKGKGGKAKSKTASPPSSEAIAGGDYVYDPTTNSFTEVGK